MTGPCVAGSGAGPLFLPPPTTPIQLLIRSGNSYAALPAGSNYTFLVLLDSTTTGNTGLCGRRTPVGLCGS